MWFGANNQCCTCTVLGCANRTFELGGQTHEGRLFHRTNYLRHLAAGKKATSEIAQPEPSNLIHPTDPSLSQSRLGINQDNGPTQVSGGAPMEVSSKLTNQESTRKKRD